MKSKLLGAILSTPCFLLASCQTVPQTDPLRPDLEHPERLICVEAGERPALPEAYVIDWSKVETVEQAKAEHEKAVASIYKRNGLVVAYLQTIEGKLFVCSNNMQWWRDYWTGLGERTG